MNDCTTQAYDGDPTMTMVHALNDGSLTGLATHHLMKMQLLELRSLPETPDPAATNFYH
ncbi:MAG: hypothetical protein JO304_10780 [Solirubrobacterales bacterium]|nr:hypothetical protein [Solirubrobacterales bacterium]